MKAEQRKELETNTLADKMGQMMQRVQTSPRRTYMTYGLIALAIAVAAFLGWRWWQQDVVERSAQWVIFYDGAGMQMEGLGQLKEANPNVSKAARFQLAWTNYWNFGIKMLGTDKNGSILRLRDAAKEYGALAEECKDDSNKLFLLQALLGRAVCTETLAVEDTGNLKKATEYYEEIVKDFDKEKYAEAKYASERLEILKDERKRNDLAASYSQLQSILGVEKRVEIPDFRKK